MGTGISAAGGMNSPAMDRMKEQQQLSQVQANLAQLQGGGAGAAGAGGMGGASQSQGGGQGGDNVGDIMNKFANGIDPGQNATSVSKGYEYSQNLDVGGGVNVIA